MAPIRGYSRLAPLIVVALMLVVAGCSVEFGSQGSDQGSGTQGANNQESSSQDTNQGSGSQNANSGNAGDGGDSNASNSPSSEAPEQPDGTPSAEQAVGDYYRAAGAERWNYTYDHLSSDTQSVVSENVWVNRNQWVWDKRPVIYNILSVETYSNSDGRFADVKLRTSGIKDGEVADRTATFVLEGDGWKYAPSDRTIDWLMPNATFQEFVNARSGGSSGDAVMTEGNGDEQGNFSDKYTGTLVQAFEEADTAEFKAVVNALPRSQIQNKSPGSVVATVNYPSLGCSGEWMLEEFNGASYVVTEQLEEGDHSCLDGMTITISYDEDAPVIWYDWQGDTGYGRSMIHSSLVEDGVEIFDTGTCEVGTQDPDCVDEYYEQFNNNYGGQTESDETSAQQGFEPFVGDWRVHGTQMTIRSDFTGETTSNVGPCITSLDYEGPMCNEIHQLEFSEATSGGIVASITSIDYETWEGDSPPSGFEPSGTYQVGDSFKLEFVDDNLLRTTYLGQAADLNGQGNPYWCNSQTSEANVPKCGA